ncbi:DNA polymerase III subunit delta' [Falsibacillus albus]|uniref:DNA polymerase III subunit delta' n=1 Tax=Falsibacillus albus TaxID=2478915 RepID=A0A3L7JLT6_9BACI|nr:DNA polymerase III subunit delta' [Falsibacillus albus]RLQ91703.1 DNA polymerase III subunit delta' [Falsibacillus albus]
MKTWEQFKTVQPVAMKMIENSLEKNRVAHAYLFDGERGTGKREAGYLFAKSLFCDDPIGRYIPCEQCINCKRINHGNHPDVHVIEPDGLSIKKGQIQELQAEFSKTGVESNKKLYIIVHADKMTVNAANSLLKFLEEPHAETMAILLTEQVHRILPTIISRCQLINFRPLPPEILKDNLQKEGVHPHMAPLLASLTNNFDEAMQLNSEEWFAQARKIVLKLYEGLKKSPLQAMVGLQDEWFAHFKEKSQIERGLELLLLIYKDLLYIQIDRGEQLVFPDYRQQLEADALHTSARQLSDQMTAILEAKRKLISNMNPQLLLEQLVLELQGGSSFV